MGRGKMDEAAAARIRKARGEKDEFARRAAIAARANKESADAKSSKEGENDASKQGQGSGQKKK